ncbi:MAG: CdaR family protein, partial [Bryobacteraceae bacterium]
VVYSSLPPDLLIAPEAANAVEVELRGPSSRVTASSLADIAVTLDLSGASEPGERTFTISGDNLRLPRRVSFVRAVPSQLRLELARRKTREIPVRIRIAQPPPAGYRVASREVLPGDLRVAGPERRVDAIDSAETDGIDLSGVTADSEIRVSAYIADPQVWIESSPLVTVRLGIEKLK